MARVERTPPGSATSRGLIVIAVLVALSAGAVWRGAPGRGGGAGGPEMNDELTRFAQAGDLAGVRRCLDAGVPVDWISNGRFNETPLQLASRAGHEAVARTLLAAGANARHEDNDGFTPVTAAARAKQWTVVLLLIEHGADPSVPDGYGHAARDYLRQCGDKRWRERIEAALSGSK